MIQRSCELRGTAAPAAEESSERFARRAAFFREARGSNCCPVSRNRHPSTVCPDSTGSLIGLVFKAHRLVYHSTLGLRVIKQKKFADPRFRSSRPAVRLHGYLAHKKQAFWRGEQEGVKHRKRTSTTSMCPIWLAPISGVCPVAFFASMEADCCGSEAGSYLRLIDFCITQL